MKALFVSIRLTLKLALRNLGRQRQRTLSTLAAIVVGLVGLAFLDGYISYSMWGLKETIIRSGTGHFQVAADPAYFDEGDSDPFPYLLPDSTKLARELRRMPEVKEVVPSLSFQAVLGVGGKMETVRVQAMPTAMRQANLEMLKVRSGADLDPGVPGHILLGEGLASKLGVAPGATVTMFALASGGGVNNQEFTVSGTASSGIAAADAVSAFVDLGDAQALMGTDRVPLLTVYLEHTEDTDAVLASLRHHPPAAAPAGAVFRGWEELSPYFQQANGAYQMVLGVARFIVLLVALFSISGTLNLSVLERLRELGTLRAFGTRRGGVIVLVVAEGALLGLLGALLGTAIGWAATAAFNLAGGVTMPAQPGMTDPLTIFFKPDAAHALSNALWVIVAAAVGAWFPAHFATRRVPAALLASV
jgi:putative ABC transport system permease protein